MATSCGSSEQHLGGKKFAEITMRKIRRSMVLRSDSMNTTVFDTYDQISFSISINFTTRGWITETVSGPKFPNIDIVTTLEPESSDAYAFLISEMLW
jgi:hypothetical protein